MSKHTAKTLAKYYDMEVVYTWEATIDGLRIGTKKVNWKFLKSIELGMQLNVYPILKTVEDLTDEDYVSVFGPDYNHIIITDDFRVDVDGDMIADLVYKDIVALFYLGYGAVIKKDSPTGYVSIHDNLPCIRWREDGVYSL